MIAPRWKKILRDLWVNRKRIILSVLSIAIGVFAVGTISHMYLLVSRDLVKSYNSSQPADIIIQTGDLFNQDLVDALVRMPEIRAIQGWRSLSYQYRLPGKDKWYRMQLYATGSMNAIIVNRVFPETFFRPNPAKWPDPGVWPPPDDQIVIERTSLLTATLGMTSAQKGDSVILKLPGGKEKQVPIGGIAADLGRTPATFIASAMGYINFRTLEWLGETRGYDELRVITNVEPHTADSIGPISLKLKDKIERSGHKVTFMTVNPPNRHPLSNLFDPIALLLLVLGLIAIPLSAFLVINTISSFISQQVRQIGVMKSVGATTLQISALYLGMVLFFGILALVVSIPLAAVAARRFINFMSYFINFNQDRFYLPGEVLGLEFIIGLVIPVLAALQPILKGARITIREAISTYGLGQSMPKRGLIDRVMERVKLFPRPVLLALRNTFRRKARLFLTIVTLTMASAIFIAVVSVRSSLLQTLEDVVRFYGFSVQMQLNQFYRMDRMDQLISGIPGIEFVEGWALQGVSRIRPDGSESMELMMIEGMPPDSKLMNPVLREGRWLVAGDENAVVISPSLLDREKDIHVGDSITLKINARNSKWVVVGVANMMDSNQSILFSNNDYLTWVMGETGRARMLLIKTKPDDAATQEQVMNAVRERFDNNGIKVGATITEAQNYEQNVLLFNILTLLLMFMALLLALVGGLGLMGLMSINVLERTREIGVMRAIGATSRSVLSIFMTEGMLVGGISWALGTLLSLPTSRALSNTIGQLFFRQDLSFSYSIEGAVIWLVLVMLIAAAATYFPARDAARLTVKDVLAYE